MEALDPNGRNVRIPDLLAHGPVFADLARHPAVVAHVDGLLGDDWLLSNFTGNIACPAAARWTRTATSRRSCPSRGPSWPNRGSGSDLVGTNPQPRLGA